MYAGVIDNKLNSMKRLQGAVNGEEGTQDPSQQNQPSGIMGLVGRIKGAMGPSPEELQTQQLIENQKRNNPDLYK